MLKQGKRFHLWLWADRLLVAGAVALSLLLLAATVRRAAARPPGSAEAVAAPAPTSEPPRREVAVPGGGSWVSYGGSAAACGDRRGAWSERGVARGEWLRAPAAPAVDIEPCAGGYTVCCLLPGSGDADDVALRLEGDVLLVDRATGAGGRAGGLKFRLPGGSAKRIADRAFSNGWLRVSVLHGEINPP